jgi:hypoxanthine phosphoribosyltransferase
MINEENFQPDVIVAIARGGYVPARILCDFLDVKTLASIRIEHYLPGASKNKIARLTDPLAIGIKGKSVLLVDDVNDTGDTLELAVKHLKKFSPKKVKAAVLIQKKTSDFLPDYFAQTIIKWRWLIYPWAVMEDISGLIAKMEPHPDSVEKAASIFRDQYKCIVPRELLKDAFLKLGRR